jgi:hypothetical protein
MNMAVFWVIAAMSPDDGGSKDLCNVCELLPDYTAIQPRRQPSLTRSVGVQHNVALNSF